MCRKLNFPQKEVEKSRAAYAATYAVSQKTIPYAILTLVTTY